MWQLSYLRALDIIAERERDARSQRLARLARDGGDDDGQVSGLRRVAARAVLGLSRGTEALAVALDGCVNQSRRTKPRPPSVGSALGL